MIRSNAMRRILQAFVLAGVLAGTSRATVPPLATWVVTFASPPTAEQVQTLLGVATGVHAYRHLPAAAVVAPASQYALIANLPGVLAVYPNRVLETVLDNSTRTLRADGVWADGYTGAGVGIAVVDAGVDGTHPDLCARPEFCNGTPVKTVQNVKISGDQSKADPVVVLEDQITTDSSSGHGSHVAGIAAGWGTASETPGKYRGVAHGARIIGLGTGEVLEVTTVLAAFDWILANHANPAYNIKVVNNSWGPGAGAQYDLDEPVQRGIAAMHDAGMTVVFGAGNDGPRTGSINVFGANPKALSAAAGTKTGHMALFSGRGVPGSPTLRPTVTAPGQFIASVRARTGFYGDIADATGPDFNDPILPPDDVSYAYASGTSMSSPHVAGVVALMQEAARVNLGRYLTPAEVRGALQNTAVSMDPARGPGGLPGYQRYAMGAGYADALAAVRAVAAGTGLQPYDDGVTEAVRAFVGEVTASGGSFATTFEVVPGATSLDVMIDWQHAASNAALQDLDIDLYRPDGRLYLSTFLHLGLSEGPNQYSSWVTTVPNERINVGFPEAGVWRAVVKGAVRSAETAYGMWSVIYPDGVPVPAGQSPASVTVAGPATPVAAGQPATLTATVRDAAGQPVANAPISWTSAGVGAIVTSEPFTDEKGTALATARSDAPGTQLATATSAGAAGTASVTWLGLSLPPVPPPPSSTPGKASGGGHFMQPNKRHFGFYAEYVTGASAPGGDLAFDDKAGTKVRAGSVETLTISGGKRAVVTGAATVNDAGGYRYELTVDDNGEPGSNDTFNLVVTHPGQPLFRYESGGTLGGGNIQVRAD